MRGYRDTSQEPARTARRGGFLKRLRDDQAGNTLAMMAVAMVPLAALVGSGVDTARTYTVKTRLQQACDAGVLAGRKFMKIDASTTLESGASAQAQAFFRNNFPAGWLSTSDVTFTPAKAGSQQVVGTATAVVPMTIMRLFNADDITVAVECEARFDVADSDIMFVLDVTGSMACRPETDCNPGVTSYTFGGQTRFAAAELSGSRMQALREAVVDFDTTIRTTADPTTRIRYGFVPYSSNVNVGAAIPAQHMVRSQVSYQSRRVVGDAQRSANWAVASGYNQSNCSSANRRVPANGYNSDGSAKLYTDAYWDWQNSRCIVADRNMRANWSFEPVEHDVSAFYSSLTGGAVPRDPTRLDGRDSTRWQGCIEERATRADASFDIGNLPPDLDPDLIPSSDATRWRPMWPDVTWGRNGGGAGTASSDTDAWFEARGGWSPYNHPNRTQGGFAACPPAARRLAEMNATQVSAYVNATEFRPHGGTYHDIGMIWGVRMLSPNGVFAADTAPGSGRIAPRRHIIFMTDGQLAPNIDIYGAYGTQRYDDRVGGGTNLANVEARHNARFLAVCEYARERLNMTVWVVAFSTGLNDDLRECASPGNAFTANNKQQLQDAFRTIAQQVAMLRLSK